MLKPVELEIELFCRGMRLSEAAGRRITRTRAGLGSGLEIVIPSRPKDIWMNVPVVERFAESSPFLFEHDTILDTRTGDAYPIRIPSEPSWYGRHTSHGTEMSRIGILQGTYLGIYVGARCIYWSSEINEACKFCTTGQNVGTVEETRKRIEDVIEVARAAQQESGSVFTHFNTGYHWEEHDDRAATDGLRMCEPYVRAVRERVGGFIGVQAVPVPKRRFDEYDQLIAAGTDHFSFCYEFEDPEWFARLCPGKANTVGQHAFFEAMEYTSRKLGRGRVSGEIIAGVEPIEATKRGIDRIVNAGAFPTVCIFRPTVGSEMEQHPSPDPEAMKDVFAYLHESCRRAGLPIGILPIEVSLVVQAEEAAGLVPPTFRTHAYRAKNWALKQLARPYVAWKLRPAG
ncbi:MAG TPA: radical SAM protein [Thermoanaerobaculia bacterium]|nr:radical SAM protein [Thermoanaerobaculia bacterium]